MNQPVPLLTLKLAKPGVELVLNSLAQLPFAQSAGLIKEIEAQANIQLDMMQRAAVKQNEMINNPPAQPEEEPAE